MPKAREGARLGHAPLVDSMINDGLWCAFENYHMGNAGEVVAERSSVTREAQDAFAVRGRRRPRPPRPTAPSPTKSCRCRCPQRDGSVTLFDRDEAIRGDTTAEALRALKPAFRKDGTVTAGNAPPVNDGASALVVMSAARAQALRG